MEVFMQYLYVLCFYFLSSIYVDCATVQQELECEFPPKYEEDLTKIRRKRLSTLNGLVCLEDYPYTVSIRLHQKHWCGGAIVSRQWILSAAQCFDYVLNEEISVRMGSVYRDFGGRILSVTDIKRHPNYRMNQYYPEHNVGMIKTNIPIEENGRIQPVALAAATADSLPSTGDMVVTGYGSVMTGHLRDGENQELRRMMVDEVLKPECRLLYGSDYQLQHDQICMKSQVKGVALCAGDTGDPLVHFTGKAQGGVLYGVALFSGTEECSMKTKPGIFAEISYSRKWIDDVLSGKDQVDQVESRNSEDSMDNTIPIEYNNAND